MSSIHKKKKVSSLISYQSSQGASTDGKVFDQTESNSFGL